MIIKKIQGLFPKAVIVLFIISIVPVLVIGYRTMKINSALLQKELLQKQKTIGERLAFTVATALKEQNQVLTEFADLHVDLNKRDFISEEDFAYLQKRVPSLFYLAILSPSDPPNILYEWGNIPISSFLSVQHELVERCLNKWSTFTSAVYYDAEKKPFIWVATPLYQDSKKSSVQAIFAVAIYLEDIFKTSLNPRYPLDMEVLLISEGQKPLAYNGAAEGLDEKSAAELYPIIDTLRYQMLGDSKSEVRVNKKGKLLAAKVAVPYVGWSIYVFQSASVVPKLFVGSSKSDLIIITLIMILFVGVVSYLVIIPITRPLARLRAAAIKLREDENFVVQRSDVEIPRNEIGDLANVFVEMSQALHQRQQELIKTQQELAQMNQVLEQRVEARTKELQIATRELVKNEQLATIGEMASIISHEIRNPLAVISNATRLLKTLVRPQEPKLIKQFSVIESEIVQANSIINEVLSYARTRKMIFSTIEVNSYLHELISSFPMPAHIKVEERLNSESVCIKVDAEEIKQALRNIITNAVDAMPAGGTLTIGSRAGRRLVCIYIQDTGTGISDEVRKGMFSPFFTTKARGTGLGLAVVRKAIFRHNGKLFIKSELGKGSGFYVFLKIYHKMGDTNYGKASQDFGSR